MWVYCLARGKKSGGFRLPSGDGTHSQRTWVLRHGIRNLEILDMSFRNKGERTIANSLTLVSLLMADYSETAAASSTSLLEIIGVPGDQLRTELARQLPVSPSVPTPIL